MQITDKSPTIEQSNWLTPEEQPVTFQIALVGCDGLVIGSDQLGRSVPMIDGKPQLAQIVFGPKYCVSAGQSIVCFAAGGISTINLARQIVSECDPASRLKDAADWELELHRLARTAPYQSPDELLIARADVIDAFWRVSRTQLGPGVILPSIQKTRDPFCIGTSTVAKFLPRHLWSPDLPVSQLKKLAL